MNLFKNINLWKEQLAKKYWSDPADLEAIQKVKKVIYQAFWTFFAGGTLGFIIETIWCYFAFGSLSSRTSNLFFPFSIVWAIGAVLLQVLLGVSKDDSTLVFFIKGTLFAGIFEFACGFAGEKILGVTFWDYTELPLHIGRYVNVFICLLWGSLCIAWRLWIYPLWSKVVADLLKKESGRKFTVALICFMIVTNCVSGMALLRMNSRNKAFIANNKMDILLDTYFNDEVLQTYFPKMKYISGERVYLSGQNE